MGKVLSLVSRPLRNFNIESRAHKIISKEKPTVAPKHKSDQIDYERVMQEYPEAYKESLKKHQQLDQFLKDVYVKSQDPVNEVKIESSRDRPLPLDRSTVQDFEYGIKEPEKIPEGKITLKSALQFITDHQNNASVHTVEKISKDYLIPADTIKNILKYYKVFEVYIPQERSTKAKFAGPSVPRIKITPKRRKLLSSEGEKDNT